MLYKICNINNSKDFLNERAILIEPSLLLLKYLEHFIHLQASLSFICNPFNPYTIHQTEISLSMQ